MNNGNYFFNSHPHKEDDRSIRGHVNPKDFSTHILTRRMTILNYWKLSQEDFSTHILTRRMTAGLSTYVNQIFFSTHILTRRMTSAQLMENNPQKFFNSHPHKEDDNNGGITRLYARFFNSHPHKEDDPKYYSKYN